jgi:hypothetical protein
LVYKVQTEEWPGGLAYLVVVALHAKYMPDDIITKVELRQMLSKVKMKKDDEPSILFEQLSAIENRFNKPGQQIPDDDLIAAVLERRHRRNTCQLLLQNSEAKVQLCT